MIEWIISITIGISLIPLLLIVNRKIIEKIIDHYGKIPLIQNSKEVQQ